MIKRPSISPALPIQNKTPERINPTFTIVLNVLYFKKAMPKTTRLTGKHNPSGKSVIANNFLSRTEVTTNGNALFPSVG